MTKTQYRKSLAELGITIIGAARVFGISPRQSARYASGETPVPEPLAKLLRLMIRDDIAPDQIRAN